MINPQKIIKQAQQDHLVNAFITQLKAYGIPKPEQEYRFHPTRKWRFDFAYLEQKIAIEIEGGTHEFIDKKDETKQKKRGRHVRPKGYADDCEKYNHAQSMGWKVYRFTGEQVLSGEAINFIKDISYENNK